MAKCRQEAPETEETNFKPAGARRDVTYDFYVLCLPTPLKMKLAFSHTKVINYPIGQLKDIILRTLFDMKLHFPQCKEMYYPITHLQDSVLLHDRQKDENTKCL